jgi:hypothetical protein
MYDDESGPEATESGPETDIDYLDQGAPQQRDASDTLEGNPGDDPLDQGIIPPDRWSAAEKYGTTAEEEESGESLDQLLAEEEPEPDPYAVADEEDEDEGEAPDATPAGGYSEDPRAGRLVGEDEGAHPDTEEDLVARDVGIDAGAASAEEAAVHALDTGDEDASDEDPEAGDH